MSWFKLHKNWLESESIELQSNSNYKEYIQRRDRFLVSCGEIIVIVDKTIKLPVLIIYPEATPYSLPYVFMLSEILSEQEIEGFSVNGINNLKSIASKIKYYNWRHQNTNGSICMLESDNLYNEGIEQFGAKEVIKRVQQWAKGVILGKSVNDNAEVELFFYFKDRVEDKMFLLTELLFDTEITSGEFFFVLNPHNYGSDKKAFVGASLIGENEAGISILPKVIKDSKHLLFTRIPNIEDLINNNDKIKELIKSEELIKGYWWDINKEPKPSICIEEIAQYIGKGSITNGYQKLLKAFSNLLIKYDNNIFIGLRFPGRKRDRDWIFLLLHYPNTPSGMVSPIKDEELIERLKTYQVKAIYSEVFTDKEFHLRNSGRTKRELLIDKSVVVIGCGALGGEISDIIGKAGVGKIHLVDNQLLQAKNSIRHIIGWNRAWFPKTIALFEHITLHNPYVEVLPLNNGIVNILNANINQYFPIDAVGISTIADDNIEGYLNEQAIINNRTIFYSRALRGGKVARIFRVIPGVDACKNCLTLYKQENHSCFIDIPEDLSLPTIRNECNNPIRPASAADLKIISSITSRLLIDYLQEEDLKVNHWIWTMEDLPMLKRSEKTQGALLSSFVQPHPNCYLCKFETPNDIIISDKCIDFMIKEIRKADRVETGGILMGFRNTDGYIIIIKATGPGPNAESRTNWFQRDIKYCQEELKKSYNELGQRGDYVGEWHYHPSSTNKPSNRDLCSLTDISNQHNYLTNKPIMLIFSKDEKYSVTVHPYNNKYYFAKCIIKNESEITDISLK
jgi:integrative and conjugative element protein (TIGR02256 family)